MHLGANTLKSSTDERLDALFDRHESLMTEWRGIMLTPTGRLRRNLTESQQENVEEIQGITRAIEREITEIGKGA